ncbi:type I DNA topoisomerase [Candidatus Azambacteria bacterium]|nr:type I DNA topoisomerase [Candidatus Azambacteria bacterium]
MSSKNNHALIIVESPTKARTISKFLPGAYHVISSYGHMRDLPRSKLGVDTEKNFEPHYIVPQKAKARVKELTAETKNASQIILATDEDREGEAIAWHITQILDAARAKSKLKNQKETPTSRIVFHEITKKAIEAALEHPRALDMNLVNAQQARRVLDRLVGYELSPFLWKKLIRGLSAGRVQSVAVRLIVEREEEIKKFIPQEYWTIDGLFLTAAKERIAAHLVKIQDERIDKFAIRNKAAADAIVNEMQHAPYHVASVTKKESRRMPLPPFTTSTLQQDAGRKLRFSAKQTMMVAQQLYEGVELGAHGSVGLITYMRTDSLNLSEDSLSEAKRVVTERFGAPYALGEPRRFKTKSKGAQEAHEAIRPTDPARHPDDIKDFLDIKQWKLYNLIWRRFIASQMTPAVFDTTAVDIQAAGAGGKTFTFRANGVVKKFAGFLAAYPIKFEDALLPEVAKGEKLDAEKVEGVAHFTEPPPRFTEASLVKALEEYGIGRPSTYAPTLSTIQARGYIDKNEQRRLQPTEIGVKVNALLTEHFPHIVDIAFTAHMEEEFDKIAEGKAPWQEMIKAFYGPFHQNLTAKYEEVKKEIMEEKTDQVCEKCGKPMVIKTGRFGKFLACTGFPDCKNTKTIKKTTGITCPDCNEGELLERKTKKKRIFWGCSRYPDCKYATWANPLKKKEEAEEAQAKEEPAEPDDESLDS